MIRFKLDCGEIICDTSDSDEVIVCQIDGDEQIIREMIDGRRGLYGHAVFLSSTTPIDLKACLMKNNISFEVVEGQEILDLYRRNLPKNVKY